LHEPQLEKRRIYTAGGREGNAACAHGKMSNHSREGCRRMTQREGRNGWDEVGERKQRRGTLPPQPRKEEKCGCNLLEKQVVLTKGQDAEERGKKRTKKTSRYETRIGFVGGGSGYKGAGMGSGESSWEGKGTVPARCSSRK